MVLKLKSRANRLRQHSCRAANYVVQYETTSILRQLVAVQVRGKLHSTPPITIWFNVKSAMEHV